ncbi:uncharacterized protein [Scyliorhinus torazame]|uniref:uncharacterized protein isoform X2 n=1 Tax=Scyliorhinus torazame TaxID=75743 RepID=UPI003B5AE6C3
MLPAGDAGAAEAEEGVDIDNVKGVLQAEQEQVQKRTFTNWVNAQLAKHKTPSIVQDLFQDLRDGHRLLDLLEVLSGQRMEHEKLRSSPAHWRSNIKTALTFLRMKSIKLVNINVLDIVEGKPTIILGLIWSIILHFHAEKFASGPQSASRQSHVEPSPGLNTPLTAPSPGKGKAVGAAKWMMSTKIALLQWVQEKTKALGVNVQDFSSSWRSGLAFAAIINALRPGLLDQQEFKHRSVRENLETVFKVAEMELKIPRLLEVQDIDVSSPDEKSIITYLFQFLQSSEEQLISMDEAEIPTAPQRPVGTEAQGARPDPAAQPSVSDDELKREFEESQKRISACIEGAVLFLEDSGSPEELIARHQETFHSFDSSLLEHFLDATDKIKTVLTPPRKMLVEEMRERLCQNWEIVHSAVSSRRLQLKFEMEYNKFSESLQECEKELGLDVSPLRFRPAGDQMLFCEDSSLTRSQQHLAVMRQLCENMPGDGAEIRKTKLQACEHRQTELEGRAQARLSWLCDTAGSPVTGELKTDCTSGTIQGEAGTTHRPAQLIGSGQERPEDQGSEDSNQSVMQANGASAGATGPSRNILTDTHPGAFPGQSTERVGIRIHELERDNLTQSGQKETPTRKLQSDRREGGDCHQSVTHCLIGEEPLTAVLGDGCGSLSSMSQRGDGVAPNLPREDSAELLTQHLTVEGGDTDQARGSFAQFVAESSRREGVASATKDAGQQAKCLLIGKDESVCEPEQTDRAATESLVQLAEDHSIGVDQAPAGGSQKLSTASVSERELTEDQTRQGPPQPGKPSPAGDDEFDHQRFEDSGQLSGQVLSGDIQLCDRPGEDSERLIPESLAGQQTDSHLTREESVGSGREHLMGKEQWDLEIEDISQSRKELQTCKVQAWGPLGVDSTETVLREREPDRGMSSESSMLVRVSLSGQLQGQGPVTEDSASLTEESLSGRGQADGRVRNDTTGPVKESLSGEGQTERSIDQDSVRLTTTTRGQSSETDAQESLTGGKRVEDLGLSEEDSLIGAEQTDTQTVEDSVNWETGNRDQDQTGVPRREEGTPSETGGVAEKEQCDWLLREDSDQLSISDQSQPHAEERVITVQFLMGQDPNYGQSRQTVHQLVEASQSEQRQPLTKEIFAQQSPEPVCEPEQTDRAATESLVQLAEDHSIGVDQVPAGGSQKLSAESVSERELTEDQTRQGPPQPGKPSPAGDDEFDHQRFEDSGQLSGQVLSGDIQLCDRPGEDSERLIPESLAGQQTDSHLTREDSVRSGRKHLMGKELKERETETVSQSGKEIQSGKVQAWGPLGVDSTETVLREREPNRDMSSESSMLVRVSLSGQLQGQGPATEDSGQQAKGLLIGKHGGGRSPRVDIIHLAQEPPSGQGQGDSPRRGGSSLQLRSAIPREQHQVALQSGKVSAQSQKKRRRRKVTAQDKQAPAQEAVVTLSEQQLCDRPGGDSGRLIPESLAGQQTESHLTREESVRSGRRNLMGKELWGLEIEDISQSGKELQSGKVQAWGPLGVDSTETVLREREPDRGMSSESSMLVRVSLSGQLQGQGPVTEDSASLTEESLSGRGQADGLVRNDTTGPAKESLSGEGQTERSIDQDSVRLTTTTRGQSGETEARESVTGGKRVEDLGLSEEDSLIGAEQTDTQTVEDSVNWETGYRDQDQTGVPRREEGTPSETGGVAEKEQCDWLLREDSDQLSISDQFQPHAEERVITVQFLMGQDPNYGQSRQAVHQLVEASQSEQRQPLTKEIFAQQSPESVCEPEQTDRAATESLVQLAEDHSIGVDQVPVGGSQKLSAESVSERELTEDQTRQGPPQPGKPSPAGDDEFDHQRFEDSGQLSGQVLSGDIQLCDRPGEDSERLIPESLAGQQNDSHLTREESVGSGREHLMGKEQWDLEIEDISQSRKELQTCKVQAWGPLGVDSTETVLSEREPDRGMSSESSMLVRVSLSGQLQGQGPVTEDSASLTEESLSGRGQADGLVRNDTTGPVKESLSGEGQTERSIDQDSVRLTTTTRGQSGETDTRESLTGGKLFEDLGLSEEDSLIGAEQTDTQTVEDSVNWETGNRDQDQTGVPRREEGTPSETGGVAEKEQCDWLLREDSNQLPISDQFQPHAEERVITVQFLMGQDPNYGQSRQAVHQLVEASQSEQRQPLTKEIFAQQSPESVCEPEQTDRAATESLVQLAEDHSIGVDQVPAGGSQELSAESVSERELTEDQTRQGPPQPGKPSPAGDDEFDHQRFEDSGQLSGQVLSGDIQLCDRPGEDSERLIPESLAGQQTDSHLTREDSVRSGRKHLMGKDLKERETETVSQSGKEIQSGKVQAWGPLGVDSTETVLREREPNRDMSSESSMLVRVSLSGQLQGQGPATEDSGQQAKGLLIGKHGGGRSPRVDIIHLAQEPPSGQGQGDSPRRGGSSLQLRSAIPREQHQVALQSGKVSAQSQKKRRRRKVTAQDKQAPAQEAVVTLSEQQLCDRPGGDSGRLIPESLAGQEIESHLTREESVRSGRRNLMGKELWGLEREDIFQSGKVLQAGKFQAWGPLGVDSTETVLSEREPDRGMSSESSMLVRVSLSGQLQGQGPVTEDSASLTEESLSGRGQADGRVRNDTTGPVKESLSGEGQTERSIDQDSVRLTTTTRGQSGETDAQESLTGGKRVEDLGLSEEDSLIGAEQTDTQTVEDSVNWETGNRDQDQTGVPRREEGTLSGTGGVAEKEQCDWLLREDSNQLPISDQSQPHSKERVITVQFLMGQDPNYGQSRQAVHQLVEASQSEQRQPLTKEIFAQQSQESVCEPEQTDRAATESLVQLAEDHSIGVDQVPAGGSQKLSAVSVSERELTEDQTRQGPPKPGKPSPAGADEFDHQRFEDSGQLSGQVLSGDIQLCDRAGEDSERLIPESLAGQQTDSHLTREKSVQSGREHLMGKEQWDLEIEDISQSGKELQSGKVQAWGPLGVDSTETVLREREPDRGMSSESSMLVRVNLSGQLQGQGPVTEDSGQQAEGLLIGKHGGGRSPRVDIIHLAQEPPSGQGQGDSPRRGGSSLQLRSAIPREQHQVALQSGKVSAQSQKKRRRRKVTAQDKQAPAQEAVVTLSEQQLCDRPGGDSGRLIPESLGGQETESHLTREETVRSGRRNLMGKELWGLEREDIFQSGKVLQAGKFQAWGPLGVDSTETVLSEREPDRGMSSKSSMLVRVSLSGQLQGQGPVTEDSASLTEESLSGRGQADGRVRNDTTGPVKESLSGEGQTERSIDQDSVRLTTTTRGQSGETEARESLTGGKLFEDLGLSEEDSLIGAEQTDTQTVEDSVNWETGNRDQDQTGVPRIEEGTPSETGGVAEKEQCDWLLREDSNQLPISDQFQPHAEERVITVQFLMGQDPNYGQSRQAVHQLVEASQSEQRQPLTKEIFAQQSPEPVCEPEQTDRAATESLVQLAEDHSIGVDQVPAGGSQKLSAVSVSERELTEDQTGQGPPKPGKPSPAGADEFDHQRFEDSGQLSGQVLSGDIQLCDRPGEDSERLIPESLAGQQTDSHLTREKSVQSGREHLMGKEQWDLEIEDISQSGKELQSGKVQAWGPLGVDSTETVLREREPDRGMSSESSMLVRVNLSGQLQGQGPVTEDSGQQAEGLLIGKHGGGRSPRVDIIHLAQEPPSGQGQGDSPRRGGSSLQLRSAIPREQHQVALQSGKVSAQFQKKRRRRKVTAQDKQAPAQEAVVTLSEQQLCDRPGGDSGRLIPESLAGQQTESHLTREETVRSGRRNLMGKELWGLEREDISQSGKVLQAGKVQAWGPLGVDSTETVLSEREPDRGMSSESSMLVRVSLSGQLQGQGPVTEDSASLTEESLSGRGQADGRVRNDTPGPVKESLSGEGRTERSIDQDSVRLTTTTRGQSGETEARESVTGGKRVEDLGLSEEDSLIGAEQTDTQTVEDSVNWETGNRDQDQTGVPRREEGTPSETGGVAEKEQCDWLLREDSNQLPISDQFQPHAEERVITVQFLMGQDPNYGQSRQAVHQLVEASQSEQRQPLTEEIFAQQSPESVCELEQTDRAATESLVQLAEDHSIGVDQVPAGGSQKLSAVSVSERELTEDQTRQGPPKPGKPSPAGADEFDHQRFEDSGQLSGQVLSGDIQLCDRPGEDSERLIPESLAGQQTDSHLTREDSVRSGRKHLMGKELKERETETVSQSGKEIQSGKVQAWGPLGVDSTETVLREREPNRDMSSESSMLVRVSLSGQLQGQGPATEDSGQQAKGLLIGKHGGGRSPRVDIIHLAQEPPSGQDHGDSPRRGGSSLQLRSAIPREQHQVALQSGKVSAQSQKKRRRRKVTAQDKQAPAQEAVVTLSEQQLCDRPGGDSGRLIPESLAGQQTESHLTREESVRFGRRNLMGKELMEPEREDISQSGKVLQAGKVQAWGPLGVDSTETVLREREPDRGMSSESSMLVRVSLSGQLQDQGPVTEDSASLTEESLSGRGQADGLVRNDTTGPVKESLSGEGQTERSIDQDSVRLTTTTRGQSGETEARESLTGGKLFEDLGLSEEDSLIGAEQTDTQTVEDSVNWETGNRDQDQTGVPRREEGTPSETGGVAEKEQCDWLLREDSDQLPISDQSQPHAEERVITVQFLMGQDPNYGQSRQAVHQLVEASQSEQRQPLTEEIFAQQSPESVCEPEQTDRAATESLVQLAEDHSIGVDQVPVGGSQKLSAESVSERELTEDQTRPGPPQPGKPSPAGDDEFDHQRFEDSGQLSGQVLSGDIQLCDRPGEDSERLIPESLAGQQTDSHLTREESVRSGRVHLMGKEQWDLEIEDISQSGKELQSGKVQAWGPLGVDSTETVLREREPDRGMSSESSMLVRVSLGGQLQGQGPVTEDSASLTEEPLSGRGQADGLVRNDTTGPAKESLRGEGQTERSIDQDSVRLTTTTRGQSGETDARESFTGGKRVEDLGLSEEDSLIGAEQTDTQTVEDSGNQNYGLLRQTLPQFVGVCQREQQQLLTGEISAKHAPESGCEQELTDRTLTPQNKQHASISLSKDQPLHRKMTLHGPERSVNPEHGIYTQLVAESLGWEEHASWPLTDSPPELQLGGDWAADLEKDNLPHRISMPPSAEEVEDRVQSGSCSPNVEELVKADPAATRPRQFHGDPRAEEGVEPAGMESVTTRVWPFLDSSQPLMETLDGGTLTDDRAREDSGKSAWSTEQEFAGFPNLGYLSERQQEKGTREEDHSSAEREKQEGAIDNKSEKSLLMAFTALDRVEEQITSLNNSLLQFQNKPKFLIGLSLKHEPHLQMLKNLQSQVNSQIETCQQLRIRESEIGVALDPWDHDAVCAVALGHTRRCQEIGLQVQAAEQALRALDRFLRLMRGMEEQGDRALEGAVQAAAARLEKEKESRLLWGTALDLDKSLTAAQIYLKDGVSGKRICCRDLALALGCQAGGVGLGLVRQESVAREELQKAFCTRQSLLISDLQQIQTRARESGLSDATLPGVQQRLRSLNDLNTELQSTAMKLGELRDLTEQLAGVSSTLGGDAQEELRATENIWEETERNIHDWQDQCCVLVAFLREFQNYKKELALTIQKGEDVIPGRSSYIHKEKLQRVLSHIDEVKLEFSNQQEKVDELRKICCHLQSELRKILDCGSLPFQSEADELLDTWLDVSERLDTYSCNLKLALSLWQDLTERGSQMEEWAEQCSESLGESVGGRELVLLEEEIQLQEQQIHSFHEKAARIQELLEWQEIPLELQVVESTVRKMLDQVKHTQKQLRTRDEELSGGLDRSWAKLEFMEASGSSPGREQNPQFLQHPQGGLLAPESRVSGQCSQGEHGELVPRAEDPSDDAITPTAEGLPQAPWVGHEQSQEPGSDGQRPGDTEPRRRWNETTEEEIAVKRRRESRLAQVEDDQREQSADKTPMDTPDTEQEDVQLDPEKLREYVTNCHQLSDVLHSLETSLKDMAARIPNSYKAAIEQVESQAELGREIRLLEMKILEQRNVAADLERRGEAGSEGPVIPAAARLWEHWLCLRDSGKEQELHSRGVREEWKTISEQIDRASIILDHLQDDFPESPREEATKAELLELEQCSSRYHGDLKHQQSVLTTLLRRVTSVLGVEEALEPTPAMPILQELQAMEDRCRSLAQKIAKNRSENGKGIREWEKTFKENNSIGDWLQQASSQQQDNDGTPGTGLQQLQDAMNAQQEAMGESSGQLQDGSSEPHTRDPAETSNQIEESRGALGDMEAKNSQSRELSVRIGTIQNGLQSVEKMLQERSESHSEAKALQKRIWRAIDDWHSVLSQLDAGVLELAEQEPDQAQELMDKLLKPFQQHQQLSRNAEQRTGLLNKIPECLEEYRQGSSSAVCCNEGTDTLLSNKTDYSSSKSLRKQILVFQVMGEGSRQKQNNLQDVASRLEELSVMYRTEEMMQRLSELQQAVSTRQEAIEHKLTELELIATEVGDIETEVKIFENKLSKINTILSSIDLYDLTIQEHLANREIILENLEEMKGLVGVMEECKESLGLPEEVICTVEVFTKMDQVNTQLGHLQEFTTQQSTMLQALLGRLQECDAEMERLQRGSEISIEAQGGRLANLTEQRDLLLNNTQEALTQHVQEELGYEQPVDGGCREEGQSPRVTSDQPGDSKVTPDGKLPSLIEEDEENEEDENITEAVKRRPTPEPAPDSWTSSFEDLDACRDRAATLERWLDAAQKSLGVSVWDRKMQQDMEEHLIQSQGAHAKEITPADETSCLPLPAGQPALPTVKPKLSRQASLQQQKELEAELSEHKALTEYITQHADKMEQWTQNQQQGTAQPVTRDTLPLGNVKPAEAWVPTKVPTDGDQVTITWHHLQREMEGRRRLLEDSLRQGLGSQVSVTAGSLHRVRRTSSTSPQAAEELNTWITKLRELVQETATIAAQGEEGSEIARQGEGDINQDECFRLERCWQDSILWISHWFDGVEEGMSSYCSVPIKGAEKQLQYLQLLVATLERLSRELSEQQCRLAQEDAPGGVIGPRARECLSSLQSRLKLLQAAHCTVRQSLRDGVTHITQYQETLRQLEAAILETKTDVRKRLLESVGRSTCEQLQLIGKMEGDVECLNDKLLALISEGDQYDVARTASLDVSPLKQLLDGTRAYLRQQQWQLQQGLLVRTQYECLLQGLLDLVNSGQEKVTQEAKRPTNDIGDLRSHLQSYKLFFRRLMNHMILVEQFSQNIPEPIVLRSREMWLKLVEEVSVLQSQALLNGVQMETALQAWTEFEVDHAFLMGEMERLNSAIPSVA